MATAIIGNQKHKLKATIVESLPDKGVSNKIYYVPNKTKGNNKYDEYVWLKDTEHPNGYFEKVGQKDIDLTNYVKYNSDSNDLTYNENKITKINCEEIGSNNNINIKGNYLNIGNTSTNTITFRAFQKIQFFDADVSLDTNNRYLILPDERRIKILYNGSRATMDKYINIKINNNETVTSLTTSIKNLGHYDTEADAINYLKTLPICADTKIIHAHLTYGDKNNPNTITVIQNVTYSWTRQVLFRGDKVQQRAIYFTNNERTEIRMVEDLQPLFGDRLKWDSNAHKYILSQFGADFNADYTDPIPTASSTSDGLISKEDKVNLDDTSTYNYIGTLNSWNKIAKLTTESIEADILNTLTITPIRGNAPTTKQELFAILDKCAIHKKFLRESSTNSHVFVNHIDSCYVIYILGNKASALNGKLVGTLILRSITITANTNETLAVLKNPLEINLEDINKKVGDLEAQVKDLTNRIATLENK